MATKNQTDKIVNLRINVTQDNISAASKAKELARDYYTGKVKPAPEQCPVTQALRARYDGQHEFVKALQVPFTMANGGAYVVRFTDKIGGQTHDFALPSEVTKALNAWDEGKAVRPFQFRVKLPASLAPNVNPAPVKKTVKKAAKKAAPKKTAKKVAARKTKVPNTIKVVTANYGLRG